MLHYISTSHVYDLQFWHMLMYGTANPEGFGSESYEGLFLTSADINRITPQMVNIPVKVEHSVSPIL